MSELKSWYDFCREESEKPEGTELTAIACPCCGRALYKNVKNVLTSHPQKHEYICKFCRWMGVA
jgi:hypothetical protein